MSDRLPPFDESAEKAVIGCCVTTPAESIPEAGLVITTPEFFYDQRCRRAWQAANSLPAENVNVITLADRMAPAMDRTAAAMFLGECQEAAFSSANLPSWLDIVQDKFILRRIIAVAGRAMAAAYESSSVEVLEAFEREALTIRPVKRAESDIRALMGEAIAMIEQRVALGGAISGLSTGLHDLDRKSDGLHPGELIVLAALPSCGKTALAVNIGVHNALAGVPVGILSAEMRPVQLALRSLCSEARVNFKHVTEGDQPALVVQVGRLSRSPLYIQQSNGWTIAQATAQARRWAQQHGIRLLVADYIQRFSAFGENREREIASIGAGFKNIALELGIPVIALSQLNDDGKLRESRALGQDGDSVWKLENDGERQPAVQSVILRIEKCRDGEVGNVPLTFFKTFTRFECQAHEQPGSVGYNPSND
jgi:replicative DNA helicase